MQGRLQKTVAKLDKNCHTVFIDWPRHVHVYTQDACMHELHDMVLEMLKFLFGW
jgi:hypothetical protein